jgi:hypothetical protein
MPRPVLSSSVSLPQGGAYGECLCPRPRISGVGREERRERLAQRRLSASLDHGSTCRERRRSPFRHSELHDVRPSPREVVAGDRDAAPAQARQTLRSLFPDSPKACHSRAGIPPTKASRVANRRAARLAQSSPPGRARTRAPRYGTLVSGQICLHAKGLGHWDGQSQSSGSIAAG